MIKNRRTWILVIFSVLALSSLFCTTVMGEPSSAPVPTAQSPVVGNSTQPAELIYPTQPPQLVYPTQTSVSLSATMVEITGVVQSLKPAEGVFNIAYVGEGLGEGDQVLTQADGRARLDLTDGTRIWVGPLSLMAIEDSSAVNGGTYTRLSLGAGQLWIILNGGRMDVTTPTGLASVEGSYLHVWVKKDTNETMITCLEGLCALSNQSGVVSITSGQSATISSNTAIPVVGTMSQQDMMNWMAVAPEASGMVTLPTATPQIVNTYPTSVFNDISLFPTATATKKPKNTKTPEPSHHHYWYDPYDSWNWDYYYSDQWDEDWNYNYNYNEDWYGGYWYNGHWYDGYYHDWCSPPSNWKSYYVRWGDTLGKIAYRFGTTVWELQRANCLSNASRIYAGTYLWVPDVDP
jgi:hypothetical protein